MDTLAVVLQEPENIDLRRVDLTPPGDDDVVVDVAWSGISTGTEKLLWSGRMPSFPGMGYPLVPGYESVGRIASVGANAARETDRRVGELVFVPGARCFGSVRGLFGGAAKRLIVGGRKAVPLPESLGEKGVLLALAGTAFHALAPNGPEGELALPDLVVGHGVLGRLIARIAVATGAAPPVVWEVNKLRASGAMGYSVVDPAEDTRRDYRRILDVSGDAGLIDTLIGCLAPGGEIVLAGFYSAPVQFAFAPAFMREARLRIAAEWREGDMAQINKLLAEGRLSLDGLITHRSDAARASSAYRTAFDDSTCLKMILDWSAAA